MHAWQLIEAHQPLTLREVDAPSAGPGEVVIDVKAAGMCHSDVTYLDGTLTHFVGYTPMTLGHEIAGTIASVGEGVTAFTPGQRVAVAANPQGPGNRFDGGYAAQVMAPAALLVPIPEDVPWEQAAPATCAGMTAIHALKQGGVARGTRVGIIGAGGLGTLAIQFAVGMGATVYIAEVNDSVHESIRGYGDVRVATSITDFADQDLDVIVDYAGFGTTTAEAIDTVRAGGTVVQIGLGREHATISSQAMVLKELHYFGALGGTTEDVADVLALIAAGDVTSDVHPIAFDELGDAMGRLASGKATGRTVAILD